MDRMHGSFDSSFSVLGAIARRRENETRQIVFNCQKILSEYPEAVIACVCRRKEGETPYPLNVEQDGTDRIITLTETELESAGNIELELRAIDGDKVRKSQTFRARVLDSLVGEGDTPASPYNDVLNRLAVVEEGAKEATTGATEAAEKAMAAVDSISDAVEKANQAAKTADEAVVIAEGAVTEATSAVEKANAATETATTAANKAETAATAAQTIADALTAAKEAGEFNGKDGSDATVTKDSVVSALGYEPEKKEGNYELIETITTTEAVAILRTNLAYKKMIVYIYASSTQSSGDVSSYFYTDTGASIYSGLQVSSNVVFKMEICVENGHMKLLHSQTKTYGRNAAYGATVPDGSSKIAKFSLTQMAAGATIEIYGIRA